MSESKATEGAAPAPYIPATTSLPEITFKAVVLGFVLAMILAGANAYLGLKVGMTVSASIPAAVISMAVLRLFRESNILRSEERRVGKEGTIVASNGTNKVGRCVK